MAATATIPEHCRLEGVVHAVCDSNIGFAASVPTR
jgi:hypothetical protein